MRKAILMRTLTKNEGGENEPPADGKDQPPAEPMPEFERLEDNVYLFDRKKTRSKKDIKRMVCDCLLTKEERQRNMFGCGEDCLNRMLMIECGSRCPLGDRCLNKRFQKRQYANVEPFYAGKKGWGLRTTKALPPGAFVMEYIGEVVDSEEFKHRVKKYAKLNFVHHYFMALKSDEIIDATMKGNITRFVNHSCDPNSETQKWTINGELRIGFFTTRVVEAGEEITFDYQFQRYGKEAQKCYCESPNCRGQIGASEVSTIDLDGTRFAPKERAKVAAIDQKLRSREFEDQALDEEIDKLYEAGSIRNRQQTLTIARLMVRAEDFENRRKLLEVIKSTQEVAYLRLFLDYHGLQLLWSWMADLEDPLLRILILEVLEVLPVPNKTMLNDSKVLEVVERWSKQTDVQPPAAEGQEEKPPEVYIHALRILNLWKDLKEGFKIPRLVREKRKEDEKEADERAREYEERSARGLPVSYKGRRGPDQKDTIAAILKARNSKKPSTERRQNGFQNGYNYNAGYSEPTTPNTPQSSQDATQPKLSKEEHRREFEKNAIHAEYKTAMKKYEDQLAVYNQLFQNFLNSGVLPNGLPQMPQMPTLDSMGQVGYVTDSSTAYSAGYWNHAQSANPQLGAIQNGSEVHTDSADFYSSGSATPATGKIDLSISYEHQPEAPMEHTVYDIDSNEIEQSEFDQQAFEALFTPVPTLMQCSGAGHELMSDESAVLSTDYGFEYVPQHKTLLLHHSEKYPEPGIYYEFEDCTTRLKFDGSCSAVDYLTPDEALPELLVNVEGPLPRHWRRAASKKGRQYFYDKRTGETRWTLPLGSEQSSKISEAQSNIATCDKDVASDDPSRTAAQDSQNPTPATDSPKVSLQNGQASPVDDKDQMFPAICTKPKPLEPDPRKQRKRPAQDLKRHHHTKARKLASSSRSSSSNSKHHPHHSTSNAKKKPHKPITGAQAKKILDKFKLDMVEYVKKLLNLYRREDCKYGRITNDDDYKFLAKKLSSNIIATEEKHCSSIEHLACNDLVKKKAKKYVKSYMEKKRCPVFKREKATEATETAETMEATEVPESTDANDSLEGNEISETNEETTEDGVANDNNDDDVEKDEEEEEELTNEAPAQQLEQPELVT